MASVPKAQALERPLLGFCVTVVSRLIRVNKEHTESRENIPTRKALGKYCGSMLGRAVYLGRARRGGKLREGAYWRNRNFGAKPAVRERKHLSLSSLQKSQHTVPHVFRSFAALFVAWLILTTGHWRGRYKHDLNQHALRQRYAAIERQSSAHRRALAVHAITSWETTAVHPDREDGRLGWA